MISQINPTSYQRLAVNLIHFFVFHPMQSNEDSPVSISAKSVIATLIVLEQSMSETLFSIVLNHRRRLESISSVCPRTLVFPITVIAFTILYVRTDPMMNIGVLFTINQQIVWISEILLVSMADVSSIVGVIFISSVRLVKMSICVIITAHFPSRDSVLAKINDLSEE
jgi:hypothetical protein